MINNNNNNNDNTDTTNIFTLFFPLQWWGVFPGQH